MPRNPPRSPAITVSGPDASVGLPESVSIYGQRPVDWEHVVDAAAARLEESWIRPDATGHMMTSGLAEEFAATLCAYGMAAAETDHMQGRMDEALAHHRHVSNDGRLPPAITAKGAFSAGK